MNVIVGAAGDAKGKKDAVTAASPTPSSSGESFLTKPVVGSVPSVKWWMAILGALAAGGAAYAYKKYRR